MTFGILKKHNPIKDFSGENPENMKPTIDAMMILIIPDMPLRGRS